MKAAIAKPSAPISALVRAVTAIAALCAIYALCAFSTPGAAYADIFYAVSNYSNGSAGVITKDGGSFSVRGDLVSNFGLDAWGFTFRDHDGQERAMIREYQYGPNDTVYVWDPEDWRTPIANTSAWGSNVHAAASGGKYLYLTTYESYKDGSRAQDTGEVVRVDTQNGYKPDKRYRYEAFTGDAGFESSPHGEAIHIEGGKIYALFGVSYKGVTEYEPTEVVEFDADLNRLRSVRLKDSAGNTGKNAMRMAAYGGKLYVANMGGYQGPDSWGDVWEVDIESMTVKRVLDGHNLPYLVDGKQVNVGMYGIQIAPDGTAFLLTGSYSGDYVFRARLFITTADRLSRGDAGQAITEFTSRRGYSWDILWDEKDSALWCMTGRSLEARDKSGNLLRQFTPAELWDNVYSVSVLDGASSGAPGGESGSPGDSVGSGGSGGGCVSGAFGIISILVVVYMMALRRKRALFAVVVLSLLLLSLGTAESAQVKFLVTRGAGVRAFSKDGGAYLQTAHFVPFKEYSLAKGPDEGGYETYTCAVEGERFHYVAGGSGSGFLKTAKVVYIAANETQKTVTIDVEKLNASRREDNRFKGDSVYFNVNDAQHLVLAPGETFKLIPIRVWQAEEGFTENYFIEPDYKVEVLGDTSAISSEWGGSPGLEYAEITGLKPGVAVLRVTYDPVRFDYDAGKGEYYNAIEPVDTGIVVVTVAESGKGKNSGVTTNIKAREYDTVYFDKAKADHAEYAFKPSANGEISVRAHKPIHANDVSWGAGWSDGVKNSDGSFTVKLYDGRNIIEVSSGTAGFSEYHVINARGLDINVKNLTNPNWKIGSALNPGEKLEITFGGIKTPLEKIAGIYNPGFPDTCYVKYDSPQGEVRGEGVQYDLSENNAITAIVPASGRVELSNGIINCDHMGDPLGNHRTRPGHEPVYPNFTAINVKGAYSVMPDLSFGLGGGSGGTADETAEVSEPVITPPSGIEAAKASLVSQSRMQALGFGEFISVGADESVTVKGSVFRERLSAAVKDSIDTGTITPLPVFSANVTGGGTALVTLKLKMGGFAGKALGSIAVLKMDINRSVVSLVLAASREGLKRGSFIWTDAAGKPIPSSDEVIGGREYFINVAIEDGSDFDLDRETAGTIVDPLAIALTDTGGGGGNGNGGSGGGGCDTGIMAVFVAALAFTLMKAKRGRVLK
ncbi:MAG: hypothetical protein LBS45_09635 [Synergistaceae bacterium]|jgi:hypothetical protein|nr:hypothetical protein [Synergistaceae bacterium]